MIVEKPFRQTATRSGDGMDVDFMAENTRHLADTLHHSDVVLNVASTIAIEASIFDTPSSISDSTDGRDRTPR